MTVKLRGGLDSLPSKNHIIYSPSAVLGGIKKNVNNISFSVIYHSLGKIRRGKIFSGSQVRQKLNTRNFFTTDKQGKNIIKKYQYLQNVVSEVSNRSIVVFPFGKHVHSTFEDNQPRTSPQQVLAPEMHSYITALVQLKY